LEKKIIEKKLPGQRTEVIPLFFYDTLMPPITDFSQRKGILYIGGFNHQPNVDAVLWFSREVLPEIKKNCPEMVFYIVGSHPPIEVSVLAGDGTEVLGFVSDEKLAELYAQVKLVVVPLRFGAGVKGKTVEAIHHSLPLVSTSIGSEGIGLEVLVPPTDTPKAFADRVVALCEDDSALRACSSQLHEYAQNNLTKTAARLKMEHLFSSLS
jgi:glycosyltransferase involved in cell wall biosynthesis